jgi:hypothetical protein
VARQWLHQTVLLAVLTEQQQVLQKLCSSSFAVMQLLYETVKATPYNPQQQQHTGSWPLASVISTYPHSRGPC